MLVLVATIALVLLGADVVQPTVVTGGSTALCLAVSYFCASAPDDLERFLGGDHRSHLHSLLVPLVLIPTLYFALYGLAVQGLQLAQVQWSGYVLDVWQYVSFLLAGTVGGTWLVHNIVDMGSGAGGGFVVTPLSPISDRTVAYSYYKSDDQMLNTSVS